MRDDATNMNRQKTKKGTRTRFGVMPDTLAYAGNIAALAGMITLGGWALKNEILTFRNPFSTTIHQTENNTQHTYEQSSTKDKGTDTRPSHQAFPQNDHLKNLWETMFEQPRKEMDISETRRGDLNDRIRAIEQDIAKPRYLSSFKQETKKTIRKTLGGKDLDRILTQFCKEEGIPLTIQQAQYQTESGFRQWDSNGNLVRNKHSGAVGIGQLLPDGVKDAYLASFYPGFKRLQEQSPIIGRFSAIHGERYSADLADLYQFKIASERGIGREKSIQEGAKKKLQRTAKSTDTYRLLHEAIEESNKKLRRHEHDLKRAKTMLEKVHQSAWELAKESAEYNILTSFAYQRRLLYTAADGNLEVKPIELLRSYASYVRGMGEVRRAMKTQKGIPNDPATVDYLQKIPIDNGLAPSGRYWIRKGMGPQYLKRNTNLSEAELERLNPGIFERMNKDSNFPITIKEGIDPYAPVFTMRSRD